MKALEYLKTSPYILTAAMQALSPLLVFPIAMAVVGDAAVGELILVQSISSAMGLLGSLGLVDAIVRMVAVGQASRSTVGLVVWGLGLSVVVAIVSDSILLLLDAAFDFVSVGFVVGVGLGPAMTVNLLCQQYRRASNRGWNFLLYATLQTVVAPVVALGAGMWGNEEYFVEYWMGAIVVISVSSLLSIGLPTASQFLHGSRMILSGVTVGAPLLLHSAFGALMVAGERWYISAELGAASVAHYQLTYLVGMAPTLLMVAMNNYFMPKCVSLPLGERLSYMKEISTRMFALNSASVLFIATFLLADPVGVVQKVGFGDMIIPCALIILCSSFFQIAYQYGMNLLYSESKTLHILMSTSIGIVVQVVIDFMYVSRIGLYAPAIALLASQMIQGMLLVLFVKRSIREYKSCQAMDAKGCVGV